MSTRAFSVTNKFWVIINKKLKEKLPTDSIPSHLQKILQFLEFENFSILSEFSYESFPYNEIEIQIRSEEYHRFVQESDGSSELTEEKLKSFYGKNYARYPQNFKFSWGDRIFIKKMLQISSDIVNLESNEAKKVLKLSKQCPKDESVFLRPNLEFLSLKSKILRRKIKSNPLSRQYNLHKDSIIIEISAEQACAWLSCPICSVKIKGCKYYSNSNDKSTWNLSNFYDHLDICMIKYNNPQEEADMTGKSNIFRYVHFFSLFFKNIFYQACLNLN